MEIRNWEIWFAAVKYEDADTVKSRPVLIIGKNIGVAVALKMTKREPRDKSDYPLKFRERAGLKMRTTVRTAKVLLLRDGDLKWRVGRIAEYDALQVQGLLMDNDE